MKKTIALFTLLLLCTTIFAAEDNIPYEVRNVRKDKIFQMKPARGKFSFEDKDAEAGYANKKTYPLEHQFKDHLSISYLIPHGAVKWGKGPKILYSAIPEGEYTWVKWGTNPVVSGTAVVLNSDWGQALDFRKVDAACTNKGQKYTMYLRLKIQGPAFNSKSTLTENSISLDKIVFVEQ